MIQELIDNASNEENSKVEDTNKHIGQRIKRKFSFSYSKPIG